MNFLNASAPLSDGPLTTSLGLGGWYLYLIILKEEYLMQPVAELTAEYLTFISAHRYNGSRDLSLGPFKCLAHSIYLGTA